MQINPIHGGGAINLGANSAAEFHSLRMVGISMSSSYEFFIDDVSQGTFDISDGSSNSAFDNLIGFQSGSSGDTGRVANSNRVLLQTDDVPELTLEVNTISGAMVIINNGTPAVGDVDFNGYAIRSPGMALDPVGWNSLQDQDIEGSGPPGDGLGWEEFDASDAGYLSEGFLTGFTTMANMASQSLGSAFNPSVFGSGVVGDLTFEYTDGHGIVRSGEVAYVTSGPSCDFDSNGSCDLNDIDLLITEIAAGTNEGAFDLNGDAVVDTADRDLWLELAGEMNLASGNPYLLGDANLDGSVDVSDFNLWNGNKFTGQALWSAGDFSADGSVDVSDFNVWNGNKFQSSDTGSGGCSGTGHSTVVCVGNVSVRGGFPATQGGTVCSRSWERLYYWLVACLRLRWQMHSSIATIVLGTTVLRRAAWGLW